MIGTSNTPLSMMSNHGDPVIADHSPPLNNVGRSQSADLFGTQSEHSQYGDESLFLHESFNKQMALPFRSPLADESFQSPMPDGSFSFNSPQTNGSDSGAHHGSMNFQSPPAQNNDGSMHYQSPAPHQVAQLHQDSGVGFATPPHSGMYNSPKDSGMVYQDSKIYSSPAQLQQQHVDQNVYQPARTDEVDFQNMGMYVNPSNLGHQQR